MKTLSSQSRFSGFTLIEILVVILIISIVTSVALLSISQNENRKLQALSNEILQTLTLAQEQAMLQPSVLGLSIKPDSYEFAAYHRSEDVKKNAWVPLQDKLLASHVIPEGIELSMQLANQEHANQGHASEQQLNEQQPKHSPQIIISTNGDITPFAIYIGKKGQSPRYVIKGDADGNVTSNLLG
jgi:general secretion pathway protein H